MELARAYCLMRPVSQRQLYIPYIIAIGQAPGLFVRQIYDGPVHRTLQDIPDIVIGTLDGEDACITSDGGSVCLHWFDRKTVVIPRM